MLQKYLSIPVFQFAYIDNELEDWNNNLQKSHFETFFQSTIIGNLTDWSVCS